MEHHVWSDSSNPLEIAPFESARPLMSCVLHTALNSRYREGFPLNSVCPLRHCVPHNALRGSSPQLDRLFPEARCPAQAALSSGPCCLCQPVSHVLVEVLAAHLQRHQLSQAAPASSIPDLAQLLGDRRRRTAEETPRTALTVGTQLQAPDRKTRRCRRAGYRRARRMRLCWTPQPKMRWAPSSSPRGAAQRPLVSAMQLLLGAHPEVPAAAPTLPQRRLPWYQCRAPVGPTVSLRVFRQWMEILHWHPNCERALLAEPCWERY
mmetsp:Transcript_26934/g.46767  ORF Transcript_26934/g.46767 Transcript_26934/m.46767 type:complete len:264 (-) Transcript_26934:1345-2136(-)